MGLEGLAPPPGAQERLLDEVLGLLEGAEHAVAVDVELAAMALDARGERGPVEAGLGGGSHVRVTAAWRKLIAGECASVAAMARGDTARLYHELTSYTPEREWTAPVRVHRVRQDFLPNASNDGRMARYASLPC
jgi:hypothetical protein